MDNELFIVYRLTFIVRTDCLPAGRAIVTLISEKGIFYLVTKGG
jgi:hypothetical protein